MCDATAQRYPLPLPTSRNLFPGFKYGSKDSRAYSLISVFRSNSKESFNHTAAWICGAAKRQLLFFNRASINAYLISSHHILSFEAHPHKEANKLYPSRNDPYRPCGKHLWLFVLLSDHSSTNCRLGLCLSLRNTSRLPFDAKSTCQLVYERFTGGVTALN